MKNLFRNTVVVVLMLPSLGWSAADGRSHIGSSLAPISIPVELSHGIRSSRVEEAMKVCMVTGDSKAGVASLLQRLANELTGGRASASKYVYVGDTVDDRNTFSVDGAIRDAKSGYSYLEMSFDSNVLTFCPELSHVIYMNGINYAEQIKLQPPAPLPRIVYRTVAQDTGYDRYGQEAGGARVLMGVSIHFEPTVYGTSVRLVNSKTGAKSAITINTVEYVECLKNELQKRAE